ncbi:unnamed protein product [Symbiodinium natans]|uniref:Uncharacterized protein n=1 Tax=Symbiodinium natans TaxID=878477 RepID=A0A812M140_9DINO|nr:unnamed protein product [Symbiodinium natans]
MLTRMGLGLETVQLIGRWGSKAIKRCVQEESHGFYFEVRIDAVTTGMPDGLAIGVTTDIPDEVREVPEILDGLKQAWLIGFDGVMYDSEDFIEPQPLRD